MKNVENSINYFIEKKANKNLAKMLIFIILLLISNLSFSQTVTLTADYGMTNVSGVTNCGGGKYKFSFKPLMKIV